MSILHIQFIDFVGPDWLYMGLSLFHDQSATLYTYLPGSQFPAGMTFYSIPLVLLGIYEVGDNGLLKSSGVIHFELLYWIQISVVETGKKMTLEVEKF